ncbi:hypothetical protein B0H17DRAFT_1133996 [Mycena rosella]|uniref:Uncharacterized protein n=2 Tax=Mycena rosella TaxID=1033263 RepID=A0AAD7GEC3_MYCRO|nr:hypothetical protein B0H17DRAFT_1133996 [Mycena rosella]
MSPRLKWDIPGVCVGCPKCFCGMSQVLLWDVPNGFVGCPTCARGTSHIANWDVPCPTAHNAEAVGAHLSDVQGGGTFMQAHLMRNAEAYLSKMEVVGAHPYNMQGRGACKVHTGKVVAVGAERSDTQGQSGTRAAVEGKIFYYMGDIPNFNR